jgi:hypothetical protein
MNRVTSSPERPGGEQPQLPLHRELFASGQVLGVIRNRGGPIRMSDFAKSRHDLNCENVANGHFRTHAPHKNHRT